MTRRPVRCALAVVVAAVALAARRAPAATITIVDLDGAGVGLNDATPTAPVGGNPGTTLGAQRLNAMRYAADVWGAVLTSAVEIRIGASFRTLACDSSSAIIGQTGTNSVHRDFVGAPVASTWYAAALANSLAGVDLKPGSDDMNATFNAAIGTSCAFSATFYYGFDARPPAGRIDFASVALHEFAHGFGFLTFVGQTGTKLSGLDDAFMRNLEDHRTAKVFPAMTDAERASASLAAGNLHWVGPFADALSGQLAAGVGPNGHIQMYAPTTYQSGSSVSHVDTAVSPNEVMEPSYTGPNHDVALTLEFLEDIGWTVASATPTRTPTPAATRTATPVPTRTATRTPTPTATPARTATGGAATGTPPATATPKPTATVGSLPSATPTPLCGVAPDPGCRTSAVVGKDLLSILDATNDERDTFSWTWSHGTTTTKADFGDPTTTDGYALCLYDGSSALVMHATVPASGTCTNAAGGAPKPCWSESATGFRYLDKTRTAGIQQIVVKSGATAATTRITVRGRGVRLDTPALPIRQPVIAQLKSARGTCWQSRYDAPALKNVAGPPGRFRDKAD